MAALIDLDRIDQRLIAALQNDARLTNKELAEQVHLAPSSCLARVRRLREAGVFEGFHAVVEPQHLGIGLQALVHVGLDRHARDDIDSFRAHALGLREVVEVWHVTGSADFLVHVAIRDAAHLRDFAMDAFTTWPHIAKLETAVVYSHDRKPAWPNLRGAGRR